MRFGVLGEAEPTSGINQGDLALSSGNYDLSYQGNNLTITKAGINQGDLALNSGNYDLSYQGNNLTITKAPQARTWVCMASTRATWH